jgi:hypothetical protein
VRGEAGSEVDDELDERAELPVSVRQCSGEDAITSCGSCAAGAVAGFASSVSCDELEACLYTCPAVSAARRAHSRSLNEAIDEIEWLRP